MSLVDDLRYFTEVGSGYSKDGIMAAAADRIESLEAQLQEYRKDAERWKTLEFLWFISESIEIHLGDDIDKWQLVFEGAECCGATWEGGDLAEIVDNIKAQFDSEPDPESDAAMSQEKKSD